MSLKKLFERISKYDEKYKLKNEESLSHMFEKLKEDEYEIKFVYIYFICEKLKSKSKSDESCKSLRDKLKKNMKRILQEKDYENIDQCFQNLCSKENNFYKNNKKLKNENRIEELEKRYFKKN